MVDLDKDPDLVAVCEHLAFSLNSGINSPWQIRETVSAIEALIEIKFALMLEKMEERIAELKE